MTPPADQIQAAREAFLDLMADAQNSTNPEADESGILYTIRTDEEHLKALANALGIETKWGPVSADPEDGGCEECIGAAIDRAIEAD